MALLENFWVMRAIVCSIGLFFAVVLYVRIFLAWLRKPTKSLWRPKNREVPPACLTDPSRGTHCFAQLKNIKLHYVEKGDKTKPLMLFLHGFPEFWYSWRHQMDEFSKDYWTVAFDMRGYGDSEKPEGISNYKMKNLVNDVKDILEFLGRDRFTLVAHDWGGIIAFSFVQTYPETVDRYIIMSSAERSLFSKHVLTPRQFLKSWYMFVYQLPYVPEFALRWGDLLIFDLIFRDNVLHEKSASIEECIEAFKYTFGKPGALTGPINYYRANVFQSIKVPAKESSSEQRPEISAPGLYFNGENDIYLDNGLLEMAKKKYKNLTTTVLQGAHHFIQQEKPKEVNKMMRDFLKQK